jgi:predicted transcriptional regulator
MYKANLSWSKLQDSFKKLEAKNLIYIETDESTRRRRIRLTESGVIFVARHKAAEGSLRQREEDRPTQG